MRAPRASSPMTLLDKLHGLLVSSIRVSLIGLFLLLVVAVFFQVIARYLFEAPPFWTEELARFTLIWITFVGAALVHHHGEHIRVDGLRESLPGVLRRLLDVATSVLALTLLALILKAGYEIVLFGTQRAPALGISMRYVYLALPAGALLMIVITLLQLVRRARRARPEDRRHVD